MGAFNRNIVTSEDVANAIAAPSPDKLPVTFVVNPPAGVVRVLADDAGGGAPPAPPAPGAPAPPVPPGGVTVPTADDYLTKLLKYVPLEVLGAYLFIAGVIDSNVTDQRAHAWWLGALLIGMLVITAVYDWRVLGVVRPGQITMSLIGLAVYIFAIGGWFATTTWYHQWYASIALPLFGLLVAIVKLKPLPVPA
jgi:hypothetical protein